MRLKLCAYFLLSTVITYLSTASKLWAESDPSQYKNVFSGSSSGSPTSTEAIPVDQASLITRIFPLQHRTPNSLLAPIQAILNGQGSVSFDRNQLIVLSTTQKLTVIEELLKKLDSPLTQLVISVRQGGESLLDSDVFDTNGRVVHTQKETKAEGGITIRRTVTKSSSNKSHQVRVLEGHSAYIHTGQSHPVIHYQQGEFGKHKYHSAHTEYRDMIEGFYVTPYIHGKNVSLTIQTKNDHFKNNQIHLQRLNTTISGQLGEWINIGGVKQQKYESKEDSHQTYQMKKQKNHPIYLKVDLAN